MPSIEVILPQFGMGMTDGLIVAWHKQPGDPVARGDALCEVEAAKAVVDVPALSDGVLERIIVPAGQSARVDTAIAVLQTDEPPSDAKTNLPEPSERPATAPTWSPAQSHAQSPDPLPVPPAEAPMQAEQQKQQQAERRTERSVAAAPQIEPRARRAARERGIDLTTLSGSGPGGRIIEEDVLNIASAAASATGERKAPLSSEPLSRDPLTRDRVEFGMEVDILPLVDLIASINKSGAAIGLNVAFVRAAALAIRNVGCDTLTIGVSEAGSEPIDMGSAALLATRSVRAQAGNGSASSDVLIEFPPAGPIDEIRQTYPHNPVHLAIAARRENGRVSAWRLRLCISPTVMTVDQAQHFLTELHTMLETPLTVFV